MKRSVPRNLLAIAETLTCFFSLISEKEIYLSLVNEEISNPSVLIELTEEINQAINEINKNMAELHETPKFGSLKLIDVPCLTAIRMGVRILKTDLPKLLSKRNFTFPKEYERIAVKEFGVTVRKNFYLITQLKEDEITLLFSFLHSLYKELPSIIKGKGGAENGNNRNGEETEN